MTLPSTNDRLAAVIAHAGTWFAWFLAPLGVCVIKRGESRYVEFHALQALHLVGHRHGRLDRHLRVAIPVFLGFHLYAAWKVWRGEEYEYPARGRSRAITLVAFRR